MAESTTEQSPTPAGQPGGRGSHTARDMVISIGLLMIGILAVAGLTRGCSFSPGGPSVAASTAPTVDAAGELRSAAQRVSFPVRRPVLPSGWRANSADLVPTGNGAGQAVETGWLTAGGNYLRLAQSGAGAVELLRTETQLDAADARVTGTVEVSGTRWTTYPGVRDEQAWVLDLGAVRLLITGSGTADEFRTMATAVQTAGVLPG